MSSAASPAQLVEINGGQGRNRTADTGIFNRGRKFEKNNLNQLLTALAM
jgi:hypothetical protein